MEQLPLVSILITSYNREKYIREALESVLKQSYTRLEIIVSDNRSTDNTVNIVREYLQDERVRLYENPTNIGQFPNRNKAASYAKGKYIKYVDSDDILYPFAIAIMVDAMERHEGAAIGVFSNTTQDHTPYPYLMTPEEAFRQYYFNAADALGMGPSGVIFLRSAFEALGGYTDHSIAGDTFLMLSIALEHPVVKIGAPQFWWRRHEGQEYANTNTANEYVLTNYRINKRIINDPLFPLSGPEKKKVLSGIDRLLFKNVWRYNFKTGHFRRGIAILKEHAEGNK